MWVSFFVVVVGCLVVVFFCGAILVGAILNLTFYIWSVDVYTEKWHIQ